MAAPIAADRCGYCRTSQTYVPWPLEIDHIMPRARGGSDAEDNLWLACRACHLCKGQQTHGRDPLTGWRVRLFPPHED
jgi:5-methylcytosine-specific restriction endonuclease McrA